MRSLLEITKIIVGKPESDDEKLLRYRLEDAVVAVLGAIRKGVDQKDFVTICAIAIDTYNKTREK